MDRNAPAGFVFNPSSSHSMYYQDKKGSRMIDLGLSLRTLQSDSCDDPSGDSAMTTHGCGELFDWQQLNQLQYSNSKNPCSKILQDAYYDEEAEGVQSEERSIYVKVTMDGLVVGRKLCMLDHSSYCSLALQLEDMFGGQCAYGLRLSEPESEYTLHYKDREENWSTVGDVPWMEFIGRVKRMRITRKSEAFLPMILERHQPTSNQLNWGFESNDSTEM
ncbi:auxin-responsive protein IAA32 isoform X1 [Eucalyptus grandis]|uniref:auxin-responsive protein IAA32 isoform X1 n=1 Tax=Eucalyptus grandis TaxID=71139 RepID=UPI00192EE5A2|nr:auxin-responsive protein IAA32 isoform X1 [Eucalyptus grandis]